MNEPWISRNLVQRAKDLRDGLGRLDSVPSAQGMSLRLDRALGVMEGDGRARPAAIALFGGTQVGKSATFNALLERAGASPVSDGRGCFTEDPVAAVHAQDLGRLPWLQESDSIRVHGPLPDVVLVDTADIDGLAGERQAKTRRVLDHADVLVYVSSPDKRSNFDVLQEVKARVKRKRWFFVLTRADQVGVEVFDDFCRGIAELGFEVGPQSCFFIDATDPEGHDLPRLRQQIFSTRPVRQLRALQEESFLGELMHALDPGEEEAAWQGVVQQVGAAEAGLNADVSEVFQDVLASAEAQRRVRQLLTVSVWREVVPRVGFPLKFAVWLRARSASLPLFWTLGRMATAGPNVFRLLTAGFQAAWARQSSSLPMEVLGRCFKPSHLDRLEHVKHQGRRVLEDLDLEELMREEEVVEESGGEGWSQLPLIGSSLQAWAEQQRLRANSSRQQVLDALQGAIGGAGAERAERALRWRHNFFGNLLPGLVLLHGFYRLVTSWIDGHWLALEFFLHFLLLLLLTLVPGVWLVAASVRRVTKRAADLDPLAHLEEPAETRDLREVRHRLEHVGQQVDKLKRRALQTREAIRRELDPASYGAVAK